MLPSDLPLAPRPSACPEILIKIDRCSGVLQCPHCGVDVDLDELPAELATARRKPQQHLSLDLDKAWAPPRMSTHDPTHDYMHVPTVRMAPKIRSTCLGLGQT